MTPRTDREIWWVGFKPDERLEAVWADFARDLEKENAALRSALAFYADPQSYGINGGNFHRVASDHGMKARAALARKETQP